MRILIADDNNFYRRALQLTLEEWGYEVVTAADGEAAWAVLSGDQAPKLAILDWMMPGLDGPEVCRLARELRRPEPTYLILLTARAQKEDVVYGLDHGADDYLTKPFDRRELESRIRVGQRVIEMQRGLAERVRELEIALGQVKELKGLLPICSYCKKVRDDQNYWKQVESYISEHTDARFSHGICPTCWDHVVTPELTRAGINAPKRL